MRLIDADEVLAKLEELRKDKIITGDHIRLFAYNAAIKIVENAPTIEPVEHGGWQWLESKVGVVRCSACNHQAYRDLHSYELFDYCPYCGARMDGDKQ